MTFLVFNSDPVIQLDLAGILQNMFPESVVIQARTSGDAEDAIRLEPDLSAAFVEMEVADIEATDLPELIADRDGKVILSYFGDDSVGHAIAHRGWVPLALPFTNETVREAILTAGLVSR